MKRFKYVLVAALIVILCSYFIYDHQYYDSISLSEKTSFENAIGQIEFTSVKVFMQDGNEFYLATGPIPPSVFLSSGPPVYIFDSDGLLVEWIRDSGDEVAYKQRWDIASAVEISIDEVLKKLKQANELKHGNI